MTQPTAVDVLIVGSGPAGSAAAYSMRRASPSLSVLLVDRAHFPRDKVCGDGLGPGVIRSLKELDLMDLIVDAPMPTDVRVMGPDGHEGFARGPIIGGKDLTGAVLPRFNFDDRLRNAALATGVEACEDWKLEGLTPLHGGVQASFATPDGPHVLRAKLVIGADGAYSAVRRLWPDFKAVPKKHTHIAMRGYAEVSDPSIGADVAPPLRLDFMSELLPAYGWVFAGPDNMSNIGVGIPIHLLHGMDRTLRQLFDDYVASLVVRGFKVGEIENVRSHQLPHAGGMSRFTSGRVALMGDAAAMINPLSGEGIFYGIAAGMILAATIVEVGLDASNLTRIYEQRFRRRFRIHLFSCYVSHLLLRNKLWARTVIRAASRDPAVMADAARMLFDEQPMRLSTGLRIARRGL